MSANIQITPALERYHPKDDARVQGKREENKAEARAADRNNDAAVNSLRSNQLTKQRTLSRGIAAQALEGITKLLEQAQGQKRTGNAVAERMAHVKDVLNSLKLPESLKPKEESKKIAQEPAKTPVEDLKKINTGMTAEAVKGKDDPEGTYNQSDKGKLDLAKLVEGNKDLNKPGEESSINQLFKRVQDKGKTPELAAALNKPSMPAMAETLRGLLPEDLASALAEAKAFTEMLAEALKKPSGEQEAKSLTKTLSQMKLLVTALEKVVPQQTAAKSSVPSEKGTKATDEKLVQILHDGDPKSPEEAEARSDVANKVAQFFAVQKGTAPMNPAARSALAQAASKMAPPQKGEVTVGGKDKSKYLKGNGPSDEGVKGERGNEASALEQYTIRGFHREALGNRA